MPYAMRSLPTVVVTKAGVHGHPGLPLLRGDRVRTDQGNWERMFWTVVVMNVDTVPGRKVWTATPMPMATSRMIPAVMY